MRARDKRAMRVAHNRARWADAWAPIDESEIYEAAPDWWLDLDTTYTEPTGEDLSYLDARRMYG